MLAIGSNPAIMTPAPNAMPATGAVRPAPLPKPTKPLPAKRRPFQVQLRDGVHAFSNLLFRKYLRSSQPHSSRFESVGPRESALVLGFPQHEVGQLVWGDHATI